MFAIILALVAELVDALDSKSSSFGSVGSIPTQGTFFSLRNLINSINYFVSLYMRLFLLGFFLIISFYSNSQNYYEEDFFDPINDSSLEGQLSFVEELLDLAGYVPEKISLYQSLPNKAHVFKVKLDSIFGGFIFVRWDKEKNENYIANKLIDPGLYYNLNSAKEVMRRQTNKTSFSTEDTSIQASDQESISDQDIEFFRQEFELEERKKALEEAKIKLKKTKKRKAKRKSKKEKKQRL